MTPETIALSKRLITDAKTMLDLAKIVFGMSGVTFDRTRDKDLDNPVWDIVELMEKTPADALEQIEHLRKSS